MTEPNDDAPAGRRRGRRPKDQKRVPLSLRVTPRMREGLERMAYNEGRSLTQETEFLLEHSLFIRGRDEGFPPPRIPPPSTRDLGDKLAHLEIKVAGLQGAIENGLQENATALTRMWLQLSRLAPQLEAKLAADATETAAAANQLHAATLRLVDALQFLDAIIKNFARAAELRNRPRPRLVPTAGGDSA